MENQSSSSSMKMQFLLLEQVQFLNVNNDDDSLLQWELVDVVESEEQEEEESDQGSDGFDSSITTPIEGIVHFLPHLVDVPDLKDDDDEDEDEDDDLDDELVPWEIGNRFGRQRMRKLGKRECSKMHNSKRNPYLFVRPGCVRGKHGLGLKHTF